MQRRYVTVDVFTEKTFGGNPLAVVLDAEGLSSAQMQAIAFEFNYAETTFVLPPQDAAHTAQVRIFTPRSEVPFAGHPNVGTAYVLARQLAAQNSVPQRLLFDEKAGLVPVEILRQGSAVVGARLTAPERLSRHSQVAAETVASCLSLNVTDIDISRRPPQVLSVGLPFLVAELRSLDALRRAKPDIREHEKLLPLDGADAIYVFVRGSEDDDLRARMFAPVDGILEDPATGSATGAVAALLAEEAPEQDAEIERRFLQGVELGRPSLLETLVTKRAGIVTATRVGGRCVQVMEGTLQIFGA